MPGRDLASTTPAILRATQPDEYERRSMAAMADHVRAMLAFQDAGAVVFDYGNNLRAQAFEAGVANAFDYPGFVPGLHPAAVLRGPRAVPLGGAVRRSGRHRPDGRGDPRALPRRRRAPPLDRDGPGEGPVPGPAGPDLLARLRRAGEGRAWRSTSSSARGEVSAPIVIGRDHLDAGSVASPNRETEAMADGSDAIADWPLLNALVNTAAGATWVSIHHGGGVGIGYSQHAGMVVVADGTRARGPEAGAGPDDRSRRWASSATSTRATSGRSRSPASAASGPDARRRCRAIG